MTAEYDETPMNCAGQIDPAPPKEHQQQLHRGLRSGLEWSGRNMWDVAGDASCCGKSLKRI